MGGLGRGQGVNNSPPFRAKFKVSNNVLFRFLQSTKA